MSPAALQPLAMHHLQCRLQACLKAPCAVQEELGKAAASRDQLQAQLDAAERCAAVLAAGQGPSLPELEGMLRRLSSQRDAAQAAAAEAQARLEQREADVSALQQRVAQMEQAAASGEASSRFAWPSGLSFTESLDGGVAAAPPGPAGHVAALQEALQAEQQQNAQLQTALHARTADMQRLKQQQQQLAVVPASGALADLTNVPKQQGKEQQQQVKRLAKQLAHAQARLRQLAGENERLMEMSNSLRAERNRLARTVQQSGGEGSRGREPTLQAAGGLGEMLPAPSPGLLPACVPPLHLWSFLAQPAAESLAPIHLGAAGSQQLLLAHAADRSSDMQQEPNPAAPAQQQQQREVVQTQQRGQGSGLDAPARSGRDDQQGMALEGQSLLPHSASKPLGGASAAANTRRAAARSASKQQRQEAAAPAGQQGSTPSPPRVRNWNVKSP